ncbi:MAG TPA: hypothetical protein VLG16_03275 [Candidatus Saccharimonadales bacterium]|nr:hypothetical protein [Candidatus Saccharimonadales bacterium]
MNERLTNGTDKTLRVVRTLAQDESCGEAANCPGVFEVPEGRLAIIGKLVDVELPPGVECAVDERVVVIERSLWDSANAALNPAPQQVS